MPPWSAIDTIMFDMDGTLLDLHFDNYFWESLVPEEYAKVHGISQIEAHDLVKLKNDKAKGSLEWYCLDYWADELSLNIVQLKKTITHKISIRPNVERLLEQLVASEKQVLLITNAHPASLEIKMEHTGIDHFFENKISSHELQLAKEHHGFWEKLQSQVSYNPQRTLLFDDSLAVLRQAQKEGIQHLYAIAKPDSQRPDLNPSEFPQVVDFDHMMLPR